MESYDHDPKNEDATGRNDGQLIGGVIGGVVGWSAGGPMGALKGASAGANVGKAIDEGIQQVRNAQEGEGESVADAGKGDPRNESSERHPS